MGRIKKENDKLRQNGGFLHTSRLTLEILWKVLEMKLMEFSFASTKRGTSEL